MARAVVDVEAQIAKDAEALVRGKGIVSGLTVARLLGVQPSEVFRALSHDARYRAHPQFLPAAWSWAASEIL
jgi:hypothetical protein